MKELKMLFIILLFGLSQFSQGAGKHIHAGTAHSVTDMLITENGANIDLIETHARSSNSMSDYQEALRNLTRRRADNPHLDVIIKDFVNEISKSSIKDFHNKYSSIKESLRESFPTQYHRLIVNNGLKDFEKYIQEFEKNYRAWTGVLPNEPVNPHRLFSWEKQFSGLSEHKELRNRLFPKMHESRQNLISNITEGNPNRLKSIWHNYASRYRGLGHKTATIMFSPNSMEAVNGINIKKIFRYHNIDLRLSLKINKIDTDKNLRIPSYVDEVDLLVSSNEHSKHIDVSDMSRHLKKSLKAWGNAGGNKDKKISFHMFEGEIVPPKAQQEKLIRELIDLDKKIKNKKFNLVINHSMHLAPNSSAIKKLARHFGSRLTVSFQPSTYRILGDEKIEKIATQLKTLQDKGFKIHFGSDDPGLYNCPVNKKCYGDPIQFFERLFSAKGSRGKYIFEPKEAIDLVDRYLHSVGAKDQFGLPRNLERLETFLDSDVMIQRGISRETFSDYLIAKICP